MDQRQALAAFSALSQETRLHIIRMLVVSGPDGMAAGAIAEKAEVSPSNVSFHLKELERAGLIAQQRESRSIIYTANYERLGGLIRFLMEDCCGGNPEICAPAAAVAACCSPEMEGKFQMTANRIDTLLALLPIAGHEGELRSALESADLPTDDIDETGRTFFRIAQGDNTVGYCGYELYGDSVLLRSVVITPANRRKGLGGRATDLLFRRAHAEGARTAYLLTTNAAPFFETLGFTPIDRAGAPIAFLQTRQAISLCPASAVLLAKTLEG